MARPRLHGTDGIRGRADETLGAALEWDDEGALNALIEHRVLCNRAMRIIGEATGLYLLNTVGDSPLVVIGWDRRKANNGLVDALESGLGAAGCRTIRVGEVPTPGLHHAVLASAADAGMMVTASHNPATDSGVKLFDSDGYKSMPETEDKISKLAWNLADGSIAAPQGKGEILDEIDGLGLYKNFLNQRIESFESLFDCHMNSNDFDWQEIIASPGLLLDCSGGAGTDWFAEELVQRNIPSIEVSSRLDPINHECGAGDFSPTAKWLASELLIETPSHRLLWTIAKRLEENEGVPSWKPGQIIGAALDGDGDRCLLIEGTSDGFQIVDGDRMCDDIMRAALSTNSGKWKMASSIESDLGLTADLDRLGEHDSITTAVGDRWLSAALWNNGTERWLKSTNFPYVIGTEDSGHLVMPALCPNTSDKWGLVGDGAATLLASLLARAVLVKGGGGMSFENGWKSRVSVRPSVRERWTGDNEIAEEVQLAAEAWCGSSLIRENIDGEPNLLLLSGHLEGKSISIAIRNSGTEAKTSISIRFAKGIEADGGELSLKIYEILTHHLSPNSQ